MFRWSFDFVFVFCIVLHCLCLPFHFHWTSETGITCTQKLLQNCTWFRKVWRTRKMRVNKSTFLCVKQPMTEQVVDFKDEHCSRPFVRKHQNCQSSAESSSCLFCACNKYRVFKRYKTLIHDFHSADTFSTAVLMALTFFSSSSALKETLKVICSL